MGTTQVKVHGADDGPRGITRVIPHKKDQNSVDRDVKVQTHPPAKPGETAPVGLAATRMVVHRAEDAPDDGTRMKVHAPDSPEAIRARLGDAGAQAPQPIVNVLRAQPETPVQTPTPGSLAATKVVVHDPGQPVETIADQMARHEATMRQSMERMEAMLAQTQAENEQLRERVAAFHAKEQQVATQTSELEKEKADGPKDEGSS